MEPTQKGISAYEGRDLPPLFDDWLRRLVRVFPMVRTYSVDINPASVAANSENTETFTVTGLKTTDIITINKPSKTTDLSILDAHVSAADTISVTFRNYSGAPIDAGEETYLIQATRK